MVVVLPNKKKTFQIVPKGGGWFHYAGPWTNREVKIFTFLVFC